MTTAQGDPPAMRAKKKPMKPFWMIARVYSVEGSYPEIVGPPIASYAEACEIAKGEAKRMAASYPVCTVVILQSMAMAVEPIGIIGMGSCSSIGDGFTEIPSAGRVSNEDFCDNNPGRPG